MGVGESLLMVIIVIGFFSFCFWGTRYVNRKAKEAGKLQEYSAAKARIRVITYSVVTGMEIVMILFLWQTIPPENRILAGVFILLALICTCYAWFRWYRFRARG